MVRRICWGLLAVLLLSALVFMPDTAAANVTTLPQTSHPVKIDGVLDELAWRDAARIYLDTETRPGENIPARVQTVAYLVEDGERLYIAFDAEDPDPTAIRAYLRDRDSAWNDDFVGIVLDTYNDHRRAFEFFSSPLGVQMDLTNDEVNQNEDSSWDAIWDSAGRIHDGGFIVEMEIPLNQLRFPTTADKQTWGIDLLRFYPRDKQYWFSNNRIDRNVNCYLCQFGKIEGLHNVRPGRDIEIVPTVTASHTSSTDEPGIVPLTSAGTNTEAGVSVRWGITPDLTANLAINPDFSQVEADVAKLDVNNQFALFFPEKRPFFLEGADYFSTPIDAVFTRTIADPDVGAKLTGKRGPHTFGVFAARDAVTNLLIPGAFGSDTTSLNEEHTAFTGRYARSFGEASRLGTLLTVRDGDGYHNYVGGADLRWKINDQHGIHAQLLHSETRYPGSVAEAFEQPQGRFSGTGAYAEYEYNSRDWFGYLRHSDAGRRFRADSGFVPRVDASQQVIGLGRIWHGGAENRWTQMRLNGDWDITHDDDGRLLEREIEAYFSVNGPMQSFTQIGRLTRDVLFDDVLFREDKLTMYTQLRPRGGLQLSLWLRYGDQIDFANTRLAVERRLHPVVEWNVTRNLLLKFRGVFVRLDSKNGPNIFDAKVYDTRLTWQFSVRSFLRLTTQFQEVERNPELYVDDVERRSRDVGRQLLYSYKLNPQTVLFLGYSDSHIDDDDLDGLTATDRTYFLKVGYAWTP